MDLRRLVPRAAVALLLAFGCGGEPEAPRPDLLLVTIDTLRADFVGCYGYPRKSSPGLDELAAAGVRFDQHLTTIATTAPAHATLFSGLYPREHGVMKNGQPLPATAALLPLALQNLGYRTGAVIGARILGSEQGFAQGFEFFDEDFDGENVLRPEGKSGKYERYAKTVVDRAVRFAKADDGRPTFLWVHFYDPHEPYAPHEPSPHRPELNLAYFNTIAEIPEGADETKHLLMLAGYESEISYTDRQLRRLMRNWDERPTGSESLVVVTSDHGEGLGEHDYQGHGFLLYEEQVHVPLVMRFPRRIEPGAVVPTITSALDVPATILDLLAAPAPAGLGGSSLVPLLAPDAAPAGRRRAFAERRMFTDSDLERSPALRTLIADNPGAGLGSVGEKCTLTEGDWKLVWNANGAHELYNLDKDPAETNNRFREREKRATAMLQVLEAWRAETLRGAEIPADAASDAMLDALGY